MFRALAQVAFGAFVHPFFGLGAFAWLYGMNRMLAASRLPAFLREAIMSADRARGGTQDARQAAA